MRKVSMMAATAAALGLAACSGVYAPNDPRVVRATSPICDTFPQLEGCQAPIGLDRVGTLIVVPR